MVIINDILDFRKSMQVKLNSQRQNFNLRDLVRHCSNLQVRADEKKIQIGCTLDYHIKDNLIRGSDPSESNFGESLGTL